jgi:hypothetical protein
MIHSLVESVIVGKQPWLELLRHKPLEHSKAYLVGIISLRPRRRHACFVAGCLQKGPNTVDLV